MIIDRGIIIKLEEGDIVDGRCVIPSVVESIDAKIFNGREDLIYLYIPDSVVVIECEAFKDCKNLKAVEGMEGVIEIGEKAFANCGLEEIDLKSKTSYIGDFAFANCDSLKSVKAPCNAYYGKGAFPVDKTFEIEFFVPSHISLDVKNRER